MVGPRTFASSAGGENAMLTIDWLFAPSPWLIITKFREVNTIAYA